MLRAAALDLDSGVDATKLISLIGLQHADTSAGWVRIRGIPMPAVDSESAVLTAQQSLRELRVRGAKVCVLLRLKSDWRKNYLPSDLNAAYESAQKLGETYAGLVDAWEVDNEPDLAFVPESAERYAAFLKASYLGLHAGTTEGRGQTSDDGQRRVPLVLMGALGLPPGPWFERFLANDGLSATDGFNLHYYGYAEDFSGVYQQFETAVVLHGAQLAIESKKENTGCLPFGSLHMKTLPIFLTEIGYGMLGKESRNTKEGRLRQWRWFKSVGEQSNALKIEAPMAFYLPPYLEYDTLEYGLTATRRDEGGKLKAEGWTAGGINYVPQDFGATSIEPWMEMIGKDIGGNQATPALAQWLGMREAHKRAEGGGLKADTSRSWTVSVPAASPVVIDFLSGEGLAFLKRYGGSFVTATAPVAVTRAESGKLKAEEAKSGAEVGRQPSVFIPQTPPSRSEEFMVHVRTQNGNLYEVYPTRQATSEWQTYLEQHENFTMSFYGRAELPWRFKDNQPASLVMVLYPKELPAVFEFRAPRIIQLNKSRDKLGTKKYGSGQVVLYNFSDKPITGQLKLPPQVARVVPHALPDQTSALRATRSTTLAPGKRCVIDVTIEVGAERFERTRAGILFVPDDASIPAARFVTEFFPALEGLQGRVVGELVRAGDRNASNARFIRERQRATEEAVMKEQGAGNSEQGVAATQLGAGSFVAFAQEGATVTRTADGFAVTVTGRPPGKERRVEVEIPWPEGLEFSQDAFLSLEYRLRP